MQFTFTPEFLSRDQALFTKYTNDYVKVYNSKISFGTAGFRAEAKHLEYVKNDRKSFDFDDLTIGDI
jgi:hypothetical protein